jgi:hypothetical protein
MRQFLDDLFHDYGLRLLPVLTGALAFAVIAAAAYVPQPQVPGTHASAR